MNDHQVLQRAREGLGRSTLTLERVSRRQRARHVRRRIGAGVTALLIGAAGFGLLVRAFDRTTSIAPADTSTAPVEGEVLHIRPDYGTHFDPRAVAASDAGFVVVGDTSLGDRTDPVWFSPDGVSWSRAPAADAPDSPNLWDVTAGGPGFVAVGLDGSWNPAAWYSSDGLVWVPADVALPSGIGNVDAMFGVLRTDTGFLARGRVRNNDAYVWTSADGRTWLPVPDESVFAGEGDQFITSIGQGPEGFLAEGYERPAGSSGQGHPVAWTSTDGMTWTRVAHLTGEKLGDMEESFTIEFHHHAKNAMGSVSLGDGVLLFQPIG